MPLGIGRFSRAENGQSPGVARKIASRSEDLTSYPDWPEGSGQQERSGISPGSQSGPDGGREQQEGVAGSWVACSVCIQAATLAVLFFPIQRRRP